MLYAGLRLPVRAGQKESGRSQLVAAPEEFEGLRNHPAAGRFRRTSSRVGSAGRLWFRIRFWIGLCCPGWCGRAVGKAAPGAFRLFCFEKGPEDFREAKVTKSSENANSGLPCAAGCRSPEKDRRGNAATVRVRIPERGLILVRIGVGLEQFLLYVGRNLLVGGELHRVGGRTGGERREGRRVAVEFGQRHEGVQAVESLV